MKIIKHRPRDTNDAPEEGTEIGGGSIFEYSRTVIRMEIIKHRPRIGCAGLEFTNERTAKTGIQKLKMGEMVSCNR
jgi:hypothetical protein